MAATRKPPLCAKRARSHIRGRRIGRAIQQLVNKTTHGGHILQLILTRKLRLHMNGQGWNDAAQVGISRALSNAVNGSLDHSSSRLATCHGVGHGQSAIVMCMAIPTVTCHVPIKVSNNSLAGHFVHYESKMKQHK